MRHIHYELEKADDLSVLIVLRDGICAVVAANSIDKVVIIVYLFEVDTIKEDGSGS